MVKQIASIVLLASCTHAPAVEPKREPIGNAAAASQVADEPEGMTIKRQGPGGVESQQRPCSRVNPSASPTDSPSHTVEVGVTKPVGKQRHDRKAHAYTGYHCDPAK